MPSWTTRRWLAPAHRDARCTPRGFERAFVCFGQVGNKRLNFDALPGASKAPVDRVDACDASNPQCIIPYLQDIHRHYREAEVCVAPSPGQTVPPREAAADPQPEAHCLLPAARSRALLAVPGGQARLALVHEQADRHQRQDARDPDRLARGGAPQVQADA